jgi:D-alanyl-D-alanine carboxypeptidase/D-alanyl-D-alanine-endopeptidase (penicillin-binding protein 4)
MLALLLLGNGPADLDRILSTPKLDGAIVSAIVTDIDGRVIYEHNSATHVVPASNQKLLSNSFALWELGPDYRPKTSFWKFPSRIIIDSPGDPLMTYEQLRKARKELGTSQDLPVYVHEEYAPQIPDGWEFDDLPNKFAAPVCAFTFDRGSFTAWSRHGKTVLLPEPFGVRTIYVAGNGKPEVRYDPFARKVTISGALPAEDTELDTLALPRPDEAAASLIGSGFESTTTLPQTQPDLVITGSSTIDIVRACLPPSDNNLAENLLMMGARKEGELGLNPYPLACRRMKSFLLNVVGINPTDIHAYDGSGLSRHDYVTTRAIAKLLRWSLTQPTGPAWRSALAHGGSGTLANRLKGINFDGKTGSLDMVSSLSGYLTTKSGKQLVVSIILNEYACTASDAHNIQDQLISALAAG